jgi:endonuclease-3
MQDQKTKKVLKKKVLEIIKVLKKLFPHPKIALNFSNPWELFVVVVLSAQCTDKKVNEVTEKLFKKYKKLDDYINADLKEFEKDIKSTGFYKNKAKNILAAAKIIKEKFGGKIPKTMEELLTLPGVGRKTANVILGNAYGVVEGIAVDTHVRRLSRLLGLTKNTQPEKIEKDLMEIVPRKYWFYITYWLIDYGRKFHPAKLKNYKNLNLPLAKFYI